MINIFSILYSFLLIGTLDLVSWTGAFGQAQLVINGAAINIVNGGHLVVNNSASNAIIRNSGSIISEGENNILTWNMGATAGSYTIPWSDGNGNYIPLSFTKTAGAELTGGSPAISLSNSPMPDPEVEKSLSKASHKFRIDGMRGLSSSRRPLAILQALARAGRFLRP